MNTTLRLKKVSILFLVIVLSACSLFQPLTSSEGGWVDWDGRGGWHDEAGGEPALAVEGSDIAFSADSPVEGEAKVYAEEPPASQTGPLRAGSVDDNTNWDDYLLYRLQFQEWGIPVHDVDVSGRHVLRVINDQQRPVLGAFVEVFDTDGKSLLQATTGADGQVYFHPQIYGETQGNEFEVFATKSNAETSTTISADTYEHELLLSTHGSADPIRLDLYFLIDATGSMSDEIQQLKDNMISVAERIAGMQANLDVRYGMTIYRDRGDLFISRTFDFTPDVSRFTEALSEVHAEGGGDYPESLNEGLHQAIHLPEWRQEETVSLMFLIADAPPHLDYAQDYDYAQDVFEAVKAGIKIFPLASSGLDDQGEYIFRQLAQLTGGKFLFLTYGPGGAPGDDTSHHVDDYSVLSLDDLVVRLVQEQLDFLNTPLQ